MNLVLAIFVVFVLGLPNFGGNNGITSVSAIVQEICDCLNPIYDLHYAWNNPCLDMETNEDLANDIRVSFEYSTVEQDMKNDILQCLGRIHNCPSCILQAVQLLYVNQQPEEITYNGSYSWS